MLTIESQDKISRWINQVVEDSFNLGQDDNSKENKFRLAMSAEVLSMGLVMLEIINQEQGEKLYFDIIS